MKWKKKPQTMNVCAFATQNNTLNGTLCVCARFFTVSSQLISTMFCGSFFCCCIFVSKWIASFPFLFFCWTNASDDLAVHKVKRKKNATTLFAFKCSDVSLFSMLRFDLFCECVFFSLLLFGLFDSTYNAPMQSNQRRNNDHVNHFK